MTTPEARAALVPVTVVCSDANVLYSRVLRDYLLYAANEGVIAVRWSQEVLDEMTKHLKRNVKGFDDNAAAALTAGMTDAFPYALVEPSVEHYQALQGFIAPRQRRPTRYRSSNGCRNTRVVHLEPERLP